MSISLAQIGGFPAGNKVRTLGFAHLSVSGVDCRNRPARPGESVTDIVRSATWWGAAPVEVGLNKRPVLAVRAIPDNLQHRDVRPRPGRVNWVDVTKP